MADLIVSQDRSKRDSWCPELSSQRETPHPTPRDPVWLKPCVSTGVSIRLSPTELRVWNCESAEGQRRADFGDFKKPIRNWLWCAWGVEPWVDFLWGEEQWFWSWIDRILLSPPKVSSFAVLDKILDFSGLSVEWSQWFLPLGVALKMTMTKHLAHTFS